MPTAAHSSVASCRDQLIGSRQCGDGSRDGASIVLPLTELGLVARVATAPDRESSGRAVAISFAVAVEPPSVGRRAQDVPGVGETFGADGRDAGAAGISEATLARFRLLDEVVDRLACLLEAAERDGGEGLPVYRDALRLAIMARLAGLNSSRRASESGAAGLPKWRLRKVRDYVDSQLADRITLDHLAEACGLSRMYFAAQFRQATGMRPHDYVLRRRIDRACELLMTSDMPIVHVAFEVGFQTQAHFTTVFKRFVGQTPYRWRRART